MPDDVRDPAEDGAVQPPQPYEPPAAEELPTTQPVETAAAITQL